MCKGTNNSDANQVFFHLFLIKITCVTATIELSVTHDADCRNTPLVISTKRSAWRDLSTTLEMTKGQCSTTLDMTR